MSHNFNQRITTALNDQQLRQNFRGAMDFLQTKRATAFEDNSEWQTLQNYGASIRRYVIAHLPELLEELEVNCTKNGIQVHWALNAEEANQIILTIAQKQNASRFIKGKSMASEEIEMNAFLNQHGMESIESDMGEYIVQLAGETPSHIIMPAIHKNKEQIATLFEDKLKESRHPDDVDGLIGVGRKVLREKFRQADIGISGVNFAIADRGTLCLVENEGNGRMSTTVPKTHIALMGIEKVIPSLDALPALQRLLTRSATGQHITTYLNLISGPRKEDELDGPEQVHLILLDNGRSTMACDEDLKTTLACIRCGACMNHCPVYTRIGGHAYGSTYPGPIGQAVTPQLKGLQQAGDLVEACSLNGACGEACPVGIELPNLIRTLRQRKQETGMKRIESWVWACWLLIHKHPKLYALSTRIAARFPFVLSHLFPGWRRSRTFPKPAAMSLHQHLTHQTQQTEQGHE